MPRTQRLAPDHVFGLPNARINRGIQGNPSEAEVPAGAATAKATAYCNCFGPALDAEVVAGRVRGVGLYRGQAVVLDDRNAATARLAQGAESRDTTGGHRARHPSGNMLLPAQPAPEKSNPTAEVAAAEARVQVGAEVVPARPEVPAPGPSAAARCPESSRRSCTRQSRQRSA